MEELLTVVKIHMIKRGRNDFVNYTAEILNCSKAWASRKINGGSMLKVSELQLLDKELNFTPEELKKIIGG